MPPHRSRHHAPRVESHGGKQFGVEERRLTICSTSLPWAVTRTGQRSASRGSCGVIVKPCRDVFVQRWVEGCESSAASSKAGGKLVDVFISRRRCADVSIGSFGERGCGAGRAD